MELFSVFRNRFLRPKSPDRWLSVTILVSLLVLIVWAGGVIPSDQSPEPAPMPTSRLPVTTQPIEASDHYLVERNYLGQIESRQQSQLSFELPGKITKIHFDESDSVTQGQLLAELDTELLKAQYQSLSAQINASKSRLDELIAGPRKEQIDAAKAAVEHWRARQKLAESTTRRQKRLIQSQATSKQELEDATFNQQATTAQVNAATAKLAELTNGTRREKIQAQQSSLQQLKAELKSISIQIQKSRLLAPYDGIISRRLLDEGVVVERGRPVLEIYDHLHLDARIGVPVDVADKIGFTTSTRCLYRGRDVDFELKSTRPEKNRTTRTIDVVYALTPTDDTFMPIGDVVEFSFRQKVQHAGFLLPTDALVEHYRGLWGCYVVETSRAGPIVKLREIQLIHQSEGQAFVQGVLHAGESVVSSGVHRLVANQRVRKAPSVPKDSSNEFASRMELRRSTQ